MDIAVESLETSALTKAKLAELLYEQIGLNKRESKDMVDAFFDHVAASLVSGQDVKITGFGNFQIRTKAPRPGRNPRTGEMVPIEARRVVTFHSSQKLGPDGREAHAAKTSTTGFGNFQIRTKAPRPGRNPRTGEMVPIEARRVVTFHSSQKLKAQIQDDDR